MVLNQQISEEQEENFIDKLNEILDSWLPFVTNYCELKDKGWHIKYDEGNQYVSEKIKNDEIPYTKQYHYAWSTCPNKKEIIEMIKSCEYLNVDEALKVFTEITGIETLVEDTEVEKAIKLLEERGRIKDGKIIV